MNLLVRKHDHDGTGKKHKDVKKDSVQIRSDYDDDPTDLVEKESR